MPTRSRTRLLAPGGRAYDAVVARFGPKILSPDGTIDRKALARVVFADKETLAALNAITHPMVREEIGWAIADHAAGRKPSPVGPGGRPPLLSRAAFAATSTR
jgi:dephospho-CoA kinase